MAKLLVIDLLDVAFDPRDAPELPSTAAWFERALPALPGLTTRVVSGGRSDLCRLAQFADGVVLGGSERDAWRDDAFNDQLLDLVALCRHGDAPLLGVCFGAQLLARALGGRVGPSPDGPEAGATPVWATEAGRGHFLLGGAPEGPFAALQSHRDAILDPPPGAELLATSERTRFQAFAVADQFFGVQFHPEMSAAGLGDLLGAWERRELGTPLGAAPAPPPAGFPPPPPVLENFARRVGLPDFGAGI